MVELAARVLLGIAGDRRHTTQPLHGGPLRHGVHAIVGALGMDIGLERLEQRVHARLVEQQHAIHATQRRHQTRPLRARLNRAPRALERMGGTIAVDRNDQSIPERAGAGEIANVADVEQIEDAVGEHDALAFGLPRLDRFDRVRARHHLFACPGVAHARTRFPRGLAPRSACSRSRAPTATAPRWLTATEPATLASAAASSDEAPAASAAEATATTASPAPVTSTASCPPHASRLWPLP